MQIRIKQTLIKLYCITICSSLQIVVEKCDVPIKSMELQLVRVETCGCAEGYAKDGKYN